MALSHSFHVIPQGQQIVQLLLLPYHAPNNFNPVTRGEKGCGSTSDQAVCFTTLPNNLPLEKLATAGT